MNRDYKAEPGGQRPAVAEDIPTCVACEGSPAAGNSPCHVCGQAAQPDPAPTVMEIIALADEIEEEGLGQIDLVRRALARWGRPAIEPVPVVERLPGVEDCDGCGNCWWFRQGTRDGFPFWWLGCGDNVSTHWLPAHALPVPTSQEDYE